MEFDIDQAIEDCRKAKTEHEDIAFAIGAGRILPKLGKAKKQAQAIEFIKALEGFIGVYPADIWHTLLIFDTLNNAKRAKNQMKAKGIPVGNVVPVLIPKKEGKTNDICRFTNRR